MDALIFSVIGDFLRHRANVRVAYVRGHTGDLAAKINAGKLDLSVNSIQVFDADNDLSLLSRSNPQEEGGHTCLKPSLTQRP